MTAKILRKMITMAHTAMNAIPIKMSTKTAMQRNTDDHVNQDGDNEGDAEDGNDEHDSDYEKDDKTEHYSNDEDRDEES